MQERIDFIATGVMRAYRKFEPTIVGIEGYPFMKNSRAISGLYELGGAVKDRLFRKHALFIEPKPSEVKHFATGNGNAKKPEMVIAAQLIWKGLPADPDHKLDGNPDLADALHIARLSENVYQTLMELA